MMLMMVDLSVFSSGVVLVLSDGLVVVKCNLIKIKWVFDLLVFMIL